MILQLTYKEFFDEIQQINEYGKCRMSLVQKALDSIHTTYENIIAEIFHISNQIKYDGKYGSGEYTRFSVVDDCNNFRVITPTEPAFLEYCHLTDLVKQPDGALFNIAEITEMINHIIKNNISKLIIAIQMFDEDTQLRASQTTLYILEESANIINYKDFQYIYSVDCVVNRNELINRVRKVIEDT